MNIEFDVYKQKLGEVKLGISLGIIEDILPIKLLIEGQPYMLMRTYGEMTPDERDIKRAETVRNSLKETI